MNYYELLGIPTTASPDEIKQAYRELVEIHHPDRMQNLRPEVRERAESQLRQINEAYQVLRHAPERERYDIALGAIPEQAVVFKPAGNPAIARSKLQAKISQLEQDIANATQRIADLRPRMEGREAADTRWERYLFVAILMGFPFIFAGQSLANYAEADVFNTYRAVAFGGFILLGYLATAFIMLISRVGFRKPGWLRLIGTAPLAAVVVSAVIFLNMPESFQLMAVAWGYVTIVWENAGKIVSEGRDYIVSAIYSVGELEDKLLKWNIEKRQLQAELARL
jgi:hypothetical protein